MTFLASQPLEQRQQQQQLALTPSDPDAFKPGFFQGSGTAAAVGLGRVGAIANQLAGEAEYQTGALFTRPLDELFDSDMTGFLNEELRQGPAELTASMTPDPYTTGSLGRILYGVVGIGVPAAVGGYFGGPAGAAAMAGSFDATGTYTDLTQQGVDPTTATGAAAFSGVLTAGGVALPGAIGGRTALNTLLYGPGINIAQDLVAGQGTAAILDARGYDELGDRYAQIDAEALVADGILGAAFGWAGARANRVPRGTAMPTHAIDAAQVALDQRHVELDTAPGIPADMATQQLHVRTLTAATEALLDGRPVEVNAERGTFVPKEANPAYTDATLLQAFRDSGLPGLLDDVAGLEAELARRGRSLEDEPLPALPMPADGVRPPPGASRAEFGAWLESVADAPITKQTADAMFRAWDDGNRAAPADGSFIATTKAGNFRLVDSAVPEMAAYQGEGAWTREIKAYDSEGNEVGSLIYTNDGTPPTVEVAETHRRKGIATAMYKLARGQGADLGDARTGVTGSGAVSARSDEGQAFRAGADESHVAIKPAAGETAEAPGAQMSGKIAATVAKEQPDVMLPGGRKAGEAMEAADAAVTKAKRDSVGFEAAVACFLRYGA